MVKLVDTQDLNKFFEKVDQSWNFIKSDWHFLSKEQENLSAHWETDGAEPFKFGEAFLGNQDGNPEPSHLTVKGVETRWRAPTFSNEYGEGIVQTTNPLNGERRKP